MERYVDENFVIQTRKKEDAEAEQAKVKVEDDRIRAKINEYETPTQFRERLRMGTGKLEPTSGVCPGFQQANLAFIPSAHVADFTEFCRRNPGPLPVLHQSYESGDFNAEPLSNDFSDARTDAAGYEVYLDGVRQEAQKYLLPPSKYEDMHVFYLGCSFGFENALTKAKIPLRNVDQQKNVSMYRTSVKMNAVGVFGGDMVVSMRYVPREMVETAAAATSPLKKSHGAPVWIGNPAALGIDQIDEPDYGERVHPNKGDVCCFWACGVSAASALQHAKLPLAAAHAPGCMFVCDKPMKEKAPASLAAILINTDRDEYSLCESLSATKIDLVEAAAARDPGHRGIQHMIRPSTLRSASLGLSHAKNILLTTGFPCNPGFPYENDGPCGILALASTLVRLGKSVTFMLDEQQEQHFTILLDEMAEQDLLPRPMPEIVVPKDEGLYRVMKRLESNEWDCLIACERTGMADDGKYHTMKGRVMPTASVDRVEDIWQRALDLEILTIAIGDGGNELGMGKVHEEIITTIPEGDLIAATTSTMYLLTCGVSNWGCWALQFALAILQDDEIHRRYLQKGLIDEKGLTGRKLIMSAGEHWRVTNAVSRQGYLDGITQSMETVDNLPWEEHKRTHQLMYDYADFQI